MLSAIRLLPIHPQPSFGSVFAEIRTVFSTDAVTVRCCRSGERNTHRVTFSPTAVPPSTLELSRDFSDDGRLSDESDDAHLGATLPTGQRVDLGGGVVVNAETRMPPRQEQVGVQLRSSSSSASFVPQSRKLSEIATLSLWAYFPLTHKCLRVLMPGSAVGIAYSPEMPKYRK